MIYLAVFLLGIWLGVVPVRSAYGINRTINFQGKLVTSSGVNVPNSTPVTATFSIYNSNSSCPGGGTPVWSENQTFTPVDGIFNVALGSQTAFGSSIDFSQDTLYLGIKISTEANEMCLGSSRIRLASVPYAFNAESFAGLTADDSQTGLFTISGGQGTERTLTVDGNITIGSTIKPTASGGLTIMSNGANTMTVDTGGSAVLNLGPSASTINLGNNASVSSAGGGNFTSVSVSADGSVNASNHGIAFTSSDSNPSCSAGEYKIFADMSETRFKKCQDGVITDLAEDVRVVNRAKSANQSVTNSTTLTDETALQFSVGANEEWNIVWNLVVSNNNSATPDWKSAVVAPSGSSCRVVLSGIEPAGTSFPQVSTTDCATPGTLVNSAINASAAPFNVYMNANILTGGTAGTVKMQFAENTAGAGTSITVMEGSIMTAYRVTGADLAEFYYSLDSSIGPGEIVSLEPGLVDGVKRSMVAYDEQVMGVVSTKPGLVMGSGANGTGGFPVLVALSGRVPVKVSSENGAIQPGDMLTTSSIPGVAMKMTRPGFGIGMAMTGFDGIGVGAVTVFVKTGWVGKFGYIQPNLNLDNFGGNQKTINISELTADRVVAGLEVITPTVYAETIYADRINAKEIAGLSDLVASESAKILKNLPTPTLFPTPTITPEVLEKLVAENGLEVNGPAVFADQVKFKKSVEFNADTAGYGVIQAGTDWVEIVFDNEYKTPPIVIIGDNYFGLKVANKTTKGFRVEYNKKPAEDIEFSWMAIAVTDPKTFRSILPTPTLTPTAIPTVILEASPSGHIDDG